MSQSRKKYSCSKDKGAGLKIVGNRMHRRIARQICEQYRNHYPLRGLYWNWYWEDWIDDPEFPTLRALINPYDICDWKRVDYNDHKYFRK